LLSRLAESKFSQTHKLTLYYYTHLVKQGGLLILFPEQDSGECPDPFLKKFIFQNGKNKITATSYPLYTEQPSYYGNPLIPARSDEHGLREGCMMLLWKRV